MEIIKSTKLHYYTIWKVADLQLSLSASHLPPLHVHSVGYQIAMSLSNAIWRRERMSVWEWWWQTQKMQWVSCVERSHNQRPRTLSGTWQEFSGHILQWFGTRCHFTLGGNLLCSYHPLNNTVSLLVEGKGFSIVCGICISVGWIRIHRMIF